MHVGNNLSEFGKYYGMAQDLQLGTHFVGKVWNLSFCTIWREKKPFVPTTFMKFHTRLQSTTSTQSSLTFDLRKRLKLKKFSFRSSYTFKVLLGISVYCLCWEATWKKNVGFYFSLTWCSRGELAEVPCPIFTGILWNFKYMNPWWEKWGCG